MAKKKDEILDDVKDVLEDAKDALEDVADAVADAAKPVVKKVKAAAKPAAKKAAKAGTEAVEAVKETAKKVTPKKPEFYVQFGGNEVNVEELAAKAKAAFKENNKRTAVLSCRIYIKPEDNAAYYVINDTFFGRIEL